MERTLIVAILIIAILLVVGIILSLISLKVKPVKCHVILFEQPPVDTMDALTESEKAAIKEFSDETFRISASGGGGGPRFSPPSGGGNSGHGGGGFSGGGHHHGGGDWGGWGGWSGWPDYYWQRPWRVPLWQMYPEYIPTYPLSFYTGDWVAPITRYVVRIGPKSDNNPFKDKGSKYGFMIAQGGPSGCGTSGARLDLQRGRTYEFDIYTSTDCVTGEQRNDPFFFTTDPNGGKETGNLFATAPIINGVLRITITDDLPNQFYYQSSKNPNVGSYVYVKP